MPCSVRSSCSVTSPRWNRWRMLRTMPGRFGALRRKPQASSWSTRCSRKLLQLRLGRRPGSCGSASCAGGRRVGGGPPFIGHDHHRLGQVERVELRVERVAHQVSAWAMSSLSSPARSGPNRMPQRRPRRGGVADVGGRGAGGQHAA